MRVIAGKYRNRNLRVSPHFRPTTDRVRETLFNMLQNQISGSVFVDAFAGSGAVGIEAISRNAAMVYFIESNRRTLQLLEKNLQDFARDENWRIFSVDAVKGLKLVRDASPSVDLVFFDPPYQFAGYSDLLEMSAALFPEASYIIESSTRTKIDAPSTVKLIKERAIGETRLSFYVAETKTL